MSGSSAPVSPNANCTYCGKPVIWAQKSPAELQRAVEEGADVSEFHRPLDATKVSAGYTIIEGAAYYVKKAVDEIYSCANEYDFTFTSEKEK